MPISEPFTSGGYSINPFPVIFQDKNPAPWNIHAINLERSPILDTTRKLSDLQWLSPHLALAMSDRERNLQNREIYTDPLGNMKDSIHSICVQYVGIQGTKTGVFSLLDNSTGRSDTMLFIANIRSDLASHAVVVEAFVLNLTEKITPIVVPRLRRVGESPIVHLKMFGDDLRAWKQALPAFAERCRTWRHRDSCEYLATGSVPLSVKDQETPICSCGAGKDVEAFVKVGAWRELSPFVTRVALGPLFAVSYLESVGLQSRPADGMSSAGGSEVCAKCGGAGKPKLLLCGKCKEVRYCSAVCQRKHWDTHKVGCKRSC